MNYTNPTRGSTTRKPNTKPFGFKRDLLPRPAEYYKAQGLKLTGGGEWKNAVCPFHKDTHPSLRVRLDTGGFRCMVCGAHGGDVLAFHRLITGLPFIRAAEDLGAWESEK
jgi:hypothetical protein